MSFGRSSKKAAPQQVFSIVPMSIRKLLLIITLEGDGAGRFVTAYLFKLMENIVCLSGFTSTF